MRNKRHLFFILILFLIISSVSFVCASENVTHNGNTKEIATLSFSDDSADEDVTDVHLDSVNKSSNSALGLAGDAQNTNDTGNDSCLTDKSQLLRASNDGRIDENGILTVKNAQLLGVPNNEPVLGNPIYPSGTTMKDVMRAILSAQPGDTVYLGGLTYTGSDTTQTNGQVYVKNVKIVGGTPDNPNMYAKFDVGNDWQSAMYFRGKSEKIQVVIDNKTQEKSSYFTNTGYFFDGVTFEHINCTGKFLDFSVGEWKNSAIIDCYSKYQFVCFTGSHHDNVPMSIINCNFTECHQTYKGKNGVEDGTGQLGAVFGVNMVNCKFINTSSAQHGGALCIADESEWGSSSVATTLTGCEFINVTSRWFAIYIHGDFRTSYDHITSPQIIDNCKFINCLGTGEYSGAVGISHDGLIVKNSLFENCSGGQGGAIMVGRIDGNHDGFSGRNTKGNNVEINNCTFNYNVASLNKTSSHCYPQYYENGTQKHGDEDFYPSGNAGAVYVFGNNTKIIDSTFNGNVAESGNGSAIMIKGINTTVTNSKFYNHTSDNGTVFIIGNNTKIINSIFENNTANNNGAGIYVKGNNTLVNESIFINQNATNGGAVYLNGNNATIINSTFTNNTVTNQGGAIYVNGSNTKLLKNEFYDNVAVPLTASSTDFTGLGGAFYVKGDNTYSELNYYDHNIARNGSAIYTDGKNFTIISDKFFENQAWSYLLEVTADPEVSLYNTSDVVIQVHHVGGDNILNAIHNVADYSEIFLKNVTYENSYGDNITTVNELKNPLEHPNSENLNEPYQEDSELYQNIDIVVYDKDNELIADVSDKRTDVRGIVTITIPKSDLTKVGDYKVHAEHDYDWNYLPINHDGKFRILGYVDLSVNKTSDKDEYFIGDTVTWTITVKNADNATAATYVNLTDVLPSEFTYVSCDPDGEYSSQSNNWTIGTIKPNETKTLTITTTANAVDTFDNVAQVYSYEEDWNTTNNKDNKTVKVVKLGVEKTVNNNTPYVGDTIEYTLTITNDGVNDYVRHLKVVDELPDGLIFADEGEISGADLINKTVVVGSKKATWYINNIPANSQAFIIVKVNVTDDGSLKNTVTIDGGSSDDETVTAVPSADLSITKTVSPETTHNDTMVTWTITVKNNGPSKAVNVKVNDALPKGLVSFKEIRNDGSSFVNGVWNVGDMENGAVCVLVLESRVNATNTTITNVVNVTSDTHDPHPENNSAENKTAIPPEADLSIVKTVDCETTHNDTVVTWTIVVTNNGPDDALNVTVCDAIPDGLVYIPENSDSHVVFNGTHVVWEIPKVVVGTPVSLTLKTRVNAANRTITNVVNVTSDIYDPFMDNNTSENKTVIPPEVYLDVNKTVEPGRVYYGDTVVFTINVTNNGPDNATNVVVKDLVPEQFKVTGANDTNFNGTHIVIPKIVPGGHYAFTITAIAIANGTWNNTASAFCVENQTIIDDDATVIVDPFADVSVNITSDKDEYFVDDVAIWTIVVSNAANGTNATNVNLKDLFPSDYFEFVNCTDEYGNVYDLGDDWVIPFMGNATDVTFVIYSVAATPGVDINNTAKVNCTEDEWNYDNNNATKLVNIVVLPQPVKEVSNSTPYYHDTIEYNLTVVNDGKDNYMDNLTVVDSLPSGLQFLETVGIVGAEFVGKEKVDGQVITWTVTNITARATITVRVKVNDLGSLTNNLTIIGPRGTEATVNCTINPVALADVSVNITSDKDEYFVDDVAIWTIVVSNAANGTNATNVSLKDLFPSDYFEFVNCTDENGNVYDLGDDWVIPFVGNGTNVTFLIHSIAKVPAENITNSVNVTCNEEEWNYDNNNASKTVEIVAFHKPVKTVSNSTPYYHDVVEYTLTVMNLGDTMYMSEFDVIDSLPDGLKYLGTVNISGAVLIRETENGQVVTWVLTQISARSNATIVIRVQVNDLGSLTNNLTVVGPHGATDMVDCTIDPIALTDVSVNITSDKDEYFVDEIAIWTVTVSNAGNGTNATNVNLKDLFPSEFEFVDCILPNGTTYNSTTGVWDIGFMGNGTDVTLVIISRAKTPADNITNSVNATCSEDEWNYINNVADKTVRIVPFPEIEKAVSNATPYNHDAVEYTLTVKNIAYIKYADNLVVIDSLPAGLIFRGTVSIIGADIVENEAVDGQTITWVITNISAKSSAVITVKVFVNDTGDFTNNLTVISPNGYNDTVNCTITAVPIADLEVIKSNDFEVNVDENLYNGDKVTWTIKVINKGPDDAVNTIVTDELPAGLIYDSDDYGGIYDQGIVSWNVGNLASGESVTIHIVTLIKASNVTITNPVGVTSDTHDPDESNNHDNSSVYVEPEADLEIIKSVSDKSPQKGDMITWTIIVKNNGADTAVNAVVTDKLPSGVVYDSDDSNGAYDSVTGIWNVGDLASGESASLRIYTKVVVTNKVIVNLASVTSDTYDPNEENNYCNDSTTVPPVSDLEITAVPDVTSVTVGDEVEYAITVVNHGPDAAINTFAKIVIPDSLRFLGVKPSKGTYDPETGIWTIGDLEPGEKAVLKLDTKVVKAGSISIKVSVESDTYDANLTNNIEPVKINPKEPNHRNGTDVPHGNSSDVPSGKVYSPEKMPATGNPIVMMLLALLAMVGLTSKRKS